MLLCVTFLPLSFLKKKVGLWKHHAKWYLPTDIGQEVMDWIHLA
jgi:hypothetical protein